MDESRLTAWKYRHAGPASRSRGQKLLAAALFAGSLLALQLPPLAFFLFAGALLALFAGTRKLLLGPRYLICGGEIVYFANIERVDRDEVAGTLSLAAAGAPPFVLERAKFPTAARKSAKIARNRAAKFAKVAERIVSAVRAANPGVEIHVHA